MVLSRETRIIWKRRLKGFWFEYSHNKIGILGLALLVFYTGLAIFGPWIAPYTEAEVRSSAMTRHADTFAMPEWITIFPAFSDWPREKIFPLNWVPETEELPESIHLENKTTGWKIYYDANKTKSEDPVSIIFKASIDYQYAPRVLRQFSLSFSWKGEPANVTKTVKFRFGNIIVYGPATGTMGYMLQLSIETPNGTQYSIWDQEWFQKRDIDPRTPPAFWYDNKSTSVTLTPLAELAVKLGYQSYETTKMVADIFSAKGTYTFMFNVTVKPGETKEDDKIILVPIEEAKGTLEISNAKFNTWGRVFGILGTDGYRHDVFSQLVIGARTSIIIGLSAAVLSVIFGLLVGIFAGYLGGIVDEILMRIVDILICLPVLPILLVLIAMFGYSVWWVVLIIAIFGWQGLSRVIRSQVLSLREMTFVESAISSGATKRYIMFRHIIPNVLPIALTSLILSVPGAIILEAALSFLGFGDPFSPTWGKILQNAYDTNAFTPSNLAWWDILPPGLAITFLCLTFVFIGHAVDEIVNPRLRRRR